MKKITIAAFVLISFAVQGQLIDLGLRGGLNIPTLKLDSQSSISDITTSNGSGWHAGIMLRVNILFLYIQPELIYTTTSTDYSFQKNGTPISNSYDMHRLDVPIPVGFKLGPAAIFAGPVASYNLSSPSDIFNNSYKTSTWGYQAGVGVKLFGILAEIRYEGPFSDYATGAEIAGENVELDARQNMWIFTLGYFF